MKEPPKKGFPPTFHASASTIEDRAHLVSVSVSRICSIAQDLNRFPGLFQQIQLPPDEIGINLHRLDALHRQNYSQNGNPQDCPQVNALYPQ